MALTMDALASFDHLVDNLPSWLSKLDELSIQVTKQHERFMSLAHSTEGKLARQKTGSTESLRPKNRNEVTVDDIERPFEITPPPFPKETQSHANDVLAIKEARRKRKPGSALSAASGPSKYRNRSMVIVYYDSDIQDAFELLVRNIATARNNLRKGKTAATFKARMASFAMGNTPFIAGGERGLFDPKMSRISKRASPGLQADKATSAFDAVDQDLEKAQSLCESAAHQVLRDGECHEEIQIARQSFQKSFSFAQDEAKRLREEKIREALEEQDTRADESTVESKTVHTSSPTPNEPPLTKPVQFAGVGAIEVDDGNSDADSVQIDISAVRRTTRRV